MSETTSAGVGVKDRVFAWVSVIDADEVIGMVRLSPGADVYRRSGGVWVKDAALARRVAGGGVRLRELRRRSLVSQEIARWDAFEAGADKGLTRLERWIAAGHRQGLAPKSSADIGDLVAADIRAAREGRSRSALRASAGVPWSAGRSRLEVERMRQRRRSRRRDAVGVAGREAFLRGRYADAVGFTYGR